VSVVIRPIEAALGQRHGHPAAKSGGAQHASLDSRDNSIASLRFLLAALVVFSHSYDLGGFGPDPLVVFSHGHQSFGGLAVAGFFALSGFLITQSYRRSHSIWRYLWHRVLRIFPAFWMCLLVTAFLFAPLISLLEHGNLAEYLHAGADSPSRYVAANALLDMKQYGIAGLLARTPYPGAFDGPLWSLHNEFICYLAVAALGILGIITRRRAILIGLTLCVWAVSLFPAIVPAAPPLALLILLFGRGASLDPVLYFFAGSLYFLFRDKIILHRRLFLLTSLLILIALSAGWGAVVLPLAMPYALLWLAFRLPMTRFGRRGDISYGVYIYAFPVQQLLATMGLHRHGLLVYLGITFALTIPLATLSWRLVEQPCLRLKTVRLPRLAACAVFRHYSLDRR